MKTILLASAAVLALGVASAPAADIARRPMPAKAPYVAPLYDWTGFYVGINGGGGFGRSSFSAPFPTGSFDTSGGLVGGTLGYNWQAGQIVFGVEGDGDWSDIRGSTRCAGTTCSVQNDWLATARGRLGYAFDRWLVYGAGGLAVADLDFHEGGLTTTIVGAKYYGWSAGGGVEGAVTDNLLARVEYLHDDYGHKDYTGVAGDVDRVSLTGETLRGALVWKFTPAARVQ